VSLRDQTKDVDLAFGQFLITSVSGERACHIRWYLFPSSMYGADRIEQVRMDTAFYQVAACTGFQRTQCLYVSWVGRQDNDPGIGKVTRDRDHRLDAAHCGY